MAATVTTTSNVTPTIQHVLDGQMNVSTVGGSTSVTGYFDAIG
jgi:hypothetical protein